MISNAFIPQPQCLPCGPKQIININMAFNNIDSISVLNNCSEPYDNETLEFAYSLDNVCWSCYMSYKEMLNATIELDSDFYVRIKVSGVVNGILIDGKVFTDYTTSIASGFTFTTCDNMQNTNLYNPYINMDCAISLQQQLTESVSCMIGIPIYYFRLSPNAGSKDITFKEYALMDIDSVKQIKMIVTENQMPSSKPVFNDFGLDWENDFETEISKATFATAFGNNVMPMEGDLIYVPMMKRMWMVNGAYEEKRDAFMWNATTFHVQLVKYQEKGSVDLGDTQSLVDTIVKNKYDDLFGTNETLGSGEQSLTTPTYTPDSLYPVFEKDATRKYMSVDTIDFKQGLLYHRSTMIADDYYAMTVKSSTIVYQKQFCGNNGVVSFIIKPEMAAFEGNLFEMGNMLIDIAQDVDHTELSVRYRDNLKLQLENNKTYFVFLRWSQELNNIEFFAAEYKHNTEVPAYMLQSHHYWFDIDNGKHKVGRYDIELMQTTKCEVILRNFIGAITNIKVFSEYNDNISEILQMYPTNSNLLINDTARKLVDLSGVRL